MCTLESKSLKNDCRLILLNFPTSYLFVFSTCDDIIIRINTNGAYNIRTYVHKYMYVYIFMYICILKLEGHTANIYWVNHITA